MSIAMILIQLSTQDSLIPLTASLSIIHATLHMTEHLTRLPKPLTLQWSDSIFEMGDHDIVLHHVPMLIS